MLAFFVSVFLLNVTMKRSDFFLQKVTWVMAKHTKHTMSSKDVQGAKIDTNWL